MINEILLNRYKIESELGKGGMGIVYRAHDNLLNRAIAIKFLNTEGVGTEGKTRLLQEARAVAQLNHPNIVSIYDASEVEGKPFIVMELVRGNTLRKAEKPSLGNVIHMAHQICLALDHAHSNGIIHRDLKLENIVIADSQTLKLMDFGLAYTTDQTRITQEDTLTGTLAYIAPELIQGQPASVQSDLYAFGIILYELLVGHEPFQGDIGAVLGGHIHGQVTPPSKLAESIPDWVNELVLGLLSKRPEDRPASARVVLDILEQKTAPSITANYQKELRPTDNLPVQLTSFVGREKEFGDVKRLLQEAHMLTLVGPGGTGKTRLSIQVAQNLLGDYSDGVWLIELASILDPLLVPRTTAIAIGLRDEPQRPVIDMLCDYLREKSMLIILDNCEHLVDACAQMANKILQAAPHVRILASSREALGIAGEVSYRVPSLGVPPDMDHLPLAESLSQYEAVKLFIDRAVSANPDFKVTNENTSFLAQICHRLDGIPLAIELAAAKIRVLNLEQIAKRLDDRFRLLTGGNRTALERHQTLRAAIDWSYNLLDDTEKFFFRRLAVFVGGWTLEAAETVCSDTSIQSNKILDLLEGLINKSMVITEETQHGIRYRVLETMRQYANEKLIESGESDILRDKHLDHFLNFAETASTHLIRSEQLSWLKQLDADYENLRAAIEWALNKNSPESSLRLCAALGKYWHLRTYWLDGTHWLKRALTKTTQNATQAENAARVKALYADAMLADELDDIERMRISAEQSFTLAQEVSNDKDIAIARLEAGIMLFRRGDNKVALPLLKQSYNEFQKLGDTYWISYSYNSLSAILEEDGELKFSERLLQAIELARQGGERLNLAETLMFYVGRLHSLNRLDEAVKYAEEADLLFNQIGSNISTSSFLFAMIAWLNGDYKKAKRLYMEMQERFGLIGEKNLRSLIIAELGLISMEQGEFEQARVQLDEALATAREINNIRSIAGRLVELGINYYLQGNFKKSKAYFVEGFVELKSLNNIFQKRQELLLMVNFIEAQKPGIIASLLGALANSEKNIEIPINPLNRRYYNRTEARVREQLGNVAFESAFAEGQKMSLDEALDLALSSVEEMLDE